MTRAEQLKELIAARLKWIRVSVLKMNQTDFASAIGLSNQCMVSGYETGNLRPSMSRCVVIIDLVKSMGVTKDPNGLPIDFEFLRPDQF